MWKQFFILCVLGLPGLVHSESQQHLPQLKVGMILPLTGALAEYGQAFQNGVRLAERDSGEVSKNCSFLVEDSKYEPKTAVAAFQKLVATDGVSVIYNWGGSTSEAIAPLADRSKVALFVWSADPRVAEGRQAVIRFSNSGADYGGTLAKFLIARGYTKVGIVKTENQYIEAILDGLKGAAKDDLKLEIVDSYQPSESDFRPTVTKLKTRRFDALGVFLLSGQVSQFINQLKAQQLNSPIFGTDFFESMTEVKHSHGGMVGSVFANNEVTAGFRNVYVKEFGNDLQINHAANGYDFTMFMCERLRPQIEQTSSHEILTRAAAVTTFTGKQGEAVFTRSDRGDKYFRFPVVIRRIRPDEIVTER